MNPQDAYLVEILKTVWHCVYKACEHVQKVSLIDLVEEIGRRGSN